MLLAVAAVFILAILARRRRHQDRARRPGRASGATLLAEGLAAGQDALLAGGEPRAAIIACYAAMERGFAVAGSAPAAADTPAEVLTRASAAGLVRSGSAEVLTGLFRRARYSSQPMTSADSKTAASALARMRADLGGTGPGERTVSRRQAAGHHAAGWYRRRGRPGRGAGRRVRRGRTGRARRRDHGSHRRRSDRGPWHGQGRERRPVRARNNWRIRRRARAVGTAEFPAYRKMASDLSWGQVSRRHYEHGVRPMLARLAAALGRPVAVAGDLTAPPDADGPGVDLATLDRIVTRLEEER